MVCQLANSKGCDGIEPDNVHSYNGNIMVNAISHFTITKKDQFNFNSYGMSVGLKNPGPLAPSHMAGLFDWALVKECNQYTDWSGGEWYSGRYGCNYAKEFIVRNKAVFVAEYVESWGNSAGVQNGIRFPQASLSPDWSACLRPVTGHPLSATHSRVTSRAARIPPPRARLYPTPCASPATRGNGKAHVWLPLRLGMGPGGLGGISWQHVTLHVVQVAVGCATGIGRSSLRNHAHRRQRRFSRVPTQSPSSPYSLPASESSSLVSSSLLTSSTSAPVIPSAVAKLLQTGNAAVLLLVCQALFPASFSVATPTLAVLHLLFSSPLLSPLGRLLSPLSRALAPLSRLLSLRPRLRPRLASSTCGGKGESSLSGEGGGMGMGDADGDDDGNLGDGEEDGGEDFWNGGEMEISGEENAYIDDGNDDYSNDINSNYIGDDCDDAVSAPSGIMRDVAADADVEHGWERNLRLHAPGEAEGEGWGEIGGGGGGGGVFGRAAVAVAVGGAIFKKLAPSLHHTLVCLGASLPIAVEYERVRVRVGKGPAGACGREGEAAWRRAHRRAASRVAKLIKTYHDNVNLSQPHQGHMARSDWLLSRWQQAFSLFLRAVFLALIFSPLLLLGPLLLLLHRLLPDAQAGEAKGEAGEDTGESKGVVVVVARQHQSTEGSSKESPSNEVASAQATTQDASFKEPSMKQRCRDTIHQLLLFALRRGGAAFIKWGQWASTREDLLPPSLCLVLGSLQDQAPTHSFSHTRRAVRKYLGCPLEDLFEEFERGALASGSIAQVHRARVRGACAHVPEWVVVKVRHPRVGLRIKQDFEVMAGVAAVVDRVPGLKWIRLQDSLEQFSHTMREQADLRVEAYHAHRLYTDFYPVRERVVIAQVLPHLVSEGVIVESFERGEPLHRFLHSKENSSLNTQIAAVGVDAYLKMLLQDNHIHLDLHPGNILARMAAPPPAPPTGEGALQPEGQAQQGALQLVILDYGLMEDLSAHVRSNFLCFIASIMSSNAQQATHFLLRFAAPFPQRCTNRDALEADMRELFARDCQLHHRCMDLNDVLKKRHAMFPASSIHGGAARASGSSPSLSASVSGGDGDSDVLDHRQLLGLLQVERRDAWGDVRGDSGGAGLWRLVPIAKELTLDAGHFIAVRAIQELRERNRSSGGDRPLLVGIGGPSGSGKSSLAHRIASMLEGTVIEQVNYMDAARRTGDMHDVDALDMALLHRHMQDLLAGRPIEMPLFDSVDRRRSGFRLITPSPSAVILLKGVYALHSRLRPLLDLGIAVVGGVHYTLLQRVKSDVAQSGLQLSLASVMHSVFPAFPLHIEPTLAHAEIRISNSFVADSLRHPFYILKSDQTVAEDRVKQVLGSTRTTRNEYRYVDVYLSPPHNPTRTKEWIRVRQCGIRYFLSVGDQRVVDRSFIIRPRAEFEVPSTTLPGLIQCSYAVAVSFSRDSVVLSNGDLSVCIDTIHLGEGHSRTYTQIKGPDRQTVLAAAAALRLEGPWVTDAYVDIVMRHVGAPRLPTPPLSSSWVRFESDQIESLTSSPSSSSFLSVPSSQPPLSTTPELPQYQPPAPPPPPSQSPPLSHSAIPSPPYPSQLPFTASPPPSQSPLPARISAALSAASAPLPVRPRAINVGSPGSSGGGGTAGGVESRPGERGVEERGVESGVEEQEPWTRSPTRASEAAALAAPASWGLTGLADSVGLMHTQMIQQVMAGGGAAEVKPSPSASAASATDATGAVTSTTSTTSRSSSTSTAGGVAAAEEGMGAAGGEGIYGATSRLATSAVGAREPLGAAGAAVSDRRQQASVQQASVQQASVQQASVQQASVRQASVQQASVQQASVQQASVQQASVQQASVQQASVRQASVRQASVQQASVQQASVQQASVQQASVQQASVQQASVQQASVQQASVRQASVQQASVQHARWEDSGSSEARGGEQQREQGGGQQGGQQGGGGMAEGGAARYRGAEGRTGGPSEQERGRGTAQGGISTQRGGVEPEMGGAASEMGGQASASQRARFDLIPKREQFNFDRGLGLAVMAVQKLLRSNGPPVIVGIGGPSGSGKTSLACNLARLLSCDLLSLDSFFNDTADGTNYDDVAVVDWPLLRRTLQDVREGRNAVTPVFDFGTMRRVGYRPVHMHGDGHGHADVAAAVAAAAGVETSWEAAGGARDGSSSSSGVLVLEGTHTLHPLLQHRLDLRIAVDGGVHSHLPARVLSDLQTCSLPRPAEEVEATLFPLFRTQIEPFLSTAHLRVVNKFDPFHARDASQFVLKSDKKVTEEDILRVVDPSTHHRRQLCYTDVFFYLPGLHPEGPVRESDWIRVRCCNNRFAVLIREPLTEGDFVIQPQVEFDIGLSTVAGLVRLGYQAGLFMEVSTSVFQDDQISVEVVGIKGLNGRRFVQIKGSSRDAVAAAGRAMRLEGTYVTKPFVEIIHDSNRVFFSESVDVHHSQQAARLHALLQRLNVSPQAAPLLLPTTTVAGTSSSSSSSREHNRALAAFMPPSYPSATSAATAGTSTPSYGVLPAMHTVVAAAATAAAAAGAATAGAGATDGGANSASIIPEVSLPTQPPAPPPPSAASATSALQQPAATSVSPSTASLAARLQLMDARLTSLERMQFLNTALLGSLLLCCCVALLFSRRPHR
ncbi:unnamed protein product [Closterium sp. NIES-65]|nr:unnamed protein product [Closterium sp. NIES-65]